MYDNSSSSSTEEITAFTKESIKKSSTTRKTMKSLFAEDALLSKHGVTSLRYEDKSNVSRSLSLSVMGGKSIPGQPPNAPSPLQTAAQAVAITYKGETPIGPCVIAVCVPHINTTITAPLIAIVDREKRPQCRVRLDENTQLLQNKLEPQYASLYDPAIGGHWSLMFKGRRECTEFVAAVHTVLHCVEIEKGPTPLFIDWDNGIKSVGNEENSENHEVVSSGDVISVSFMMWLLRRVPNTRFYSLGKLIEEVPPEAPREIIVGDGVMMIGVEEAIIGMSNISNEVINNNNNNNNNNGTSRLIFTPPKKNRVQKGVGNPEISPSDTVVVHITCHEIISRNSINIKKKQTATSMKEDFFNTGSSSKTTLTGTRMETTPVQSPTVTIGTTDTNTLLQAILLQTLQQQQQQQQQQQGGVKNNVMNDNISSGEGNGHWSTLERSMDRIHIQLASLYEKIDRLGIDEKIEKNNATIERIVKKAIGKAPVNDVDVEDMMKDRDGLLAAIERLKIRLEEETTNYHRALEAMGRHKDEVHRMQNDLQIQQETHNARVKQMEDQRRLQMMEAEVHHRQTLEHISEEKYREGYDVGFEAGRRAGQQETRESVGSKSEKEWKERLFTSEQRVVGMETTLHEREAQHIAERRRLQEQIDALHKMIEKLEKRNTDVISSSYYLPIGPDIIAQQCKTLRRALNATYTSIETQLYSIEQENVAVEDVLRIVLLAVKSEMRTFTEEIKKEAALRWGGVINPFVTEETHLERQLAAEKEVKEENEEWVEVVEKKSDINSQRQNLQTNMELNEEKLKEEVQNVRVDDLPPAPPQDTPLSMYSNLVETYPEPPELLIQNDKNDEEEEEEEENKKENNNNSKENEKSESENENSNPEKGECRMPPPLSHSDDSDW